MGAAELIAPASPKLNPQGLARRAPELMKCLPAPKGYTYASTDLGAGEPTVTAHFTQDPMYRYAAFEGVGKAPYYKNNVLMIDDIYLMAMSVSPIGRLKMWEIFNETYDGLTFAERWLDPEDPDHEWAKSLIGAQRKLHKMLALALGYGMGPKKMVKQAREAGYTISDEEAREFYNAYWKLFKKIRKFADKLGNMITNKGFIVNPFGYRLVPEPHKGYNYFIQSTVSGLMHEYRRKMAHFAPYAIYGALIHDEFLYIVPDDMLEQFRIDKGKAVDALNQDLKWSVNIRAGLVYGKTLYEAK
jgi:hypothetical protein